MIAIVNRRPMTVGILDILDAYIEHQKVVITRRTKYDLEHAKARMHIVEGLIKVLDILDEVIHLIRQSKNKQDAKQNLVNKYQFTEIQAEAIVTLQLYKLTNTDVTVLEDEYNLLKKAIAFFESVLADEEKLKDIMKKELKEIKTEYASARKTEIKDEITEIKIDTDAMIPKEDCIVLVTKDGYAKRTSLRSFNAIKEDPVLKDGDYIIGYYQLNTMDVILMFTDNGDYLYIPVYALPDVKWKEMGKHVSNIVKIENECNFIAVYPVKNFELDKYFTIFTQGGMIKRTKLEEFKVTRYNKPVCCMKLKTDDKVVSVSDKSGSEVFITTRNGYALRYDLSEVPVTGVRSSGVKSIGLKNDVVVSGNIIVDEELTTVITNKGTGKRVRISEIEKTTRARKGTLIIRDVKTNPYYLINTFVVNSKKSLGYKIGTDIDYIKLTELPIADRHSTGTSFTKGHLDESFIVQELNEQEDVNEDIEIKATPLSSIDERIMTIDDFLNEIEKK